MDTPDTRFVETPDGTHVTYQAFSEGELDIVLLPYASCVDLMWEDAGYAHILRRLGRLGRVVCAEPRGHGASDPVPEGAVPTPEMWVEDLRAVLDEIGSTKAVLIAHGTCGFLGILFAALYPERTSALVLVETWAKIVRDETYPIGTPPDTLDSFGAFVASSWGTGESIAFQAPSRADDGRFRSWLGRFERGIGSKREMMALWWWNMGLDMRAVLPSLRVPTLVLRRESNVVAPPTYADYLVEHIEGARLEVLPGADNLFFSQHTDEFVDRIEEFITGAPPAREYDRALATVLFTDIVASTERAAKLGDKRWNDLLDAHDAVVRTELERFRGTRVNPTGDGMLATFDGPARAVRCAEAIIDSLKPFELDIRAGLHTGEVELRGDDIGGIGVHIGQRISALASAGEVLVSSTVKDLVAGSGIGFEERGAHKLKGVPEEWRVFAVSRG